MDERDLNENELEAIELIRQACELLDWELAITNTGDAVHYMIIGEPDSLDAVLARINQELN